MAVMLVASGQGLIEVSTPVKKAVKGGRLYWSIRVLIKFIFMLFVF